MRNRGWRRHQNNRKLKERLRNLRHSYDYIEQMISNGHQPFYLMLNYTHRISINEVIEIRVRDRAIFEKYKLMEARKHRDNPQNCRCSHCHSYYREFNNWRDLSINEKRYYVHKNLKKNIPIFD